MFTATFERKNLSINSLRYNHSTKITRLSQPMTDRNLTIALLVDDSLRYCRLRSANFRSRLNLRRTCRVLHQCLPPIQTLPKKSIDQLESLLQPCKWNTTHITFQSHPIVIKSSRAGILISQHYPKMTCRHFISSSDMCEDCFWEKKLPIISIFWRTSMFYPTSFIFIGFQLYFGGFISYFTYHPGTWGSPEEWCMIVLGFLCSVVAGLSYANIYDRKNQRKARFIWNYVHT